MSDFMTTIGTSNCIEEVITKAKDRIVLISPYLKWSRIFFERLVEADKRNVKIAIVFGKEELRDDQRHMISQLRNLSLYYYENLHAKCYFNEQQLIISSMNLHEYSERNNREMSVRVYASDAVYKNAVAEAESIIAAVVREKNSDDRGRRGRGAQGVSAAPSKGEAGGHCIRCPRPIPRDSERPFCLDCFTAWAQWENWDFKEKFCHACGEKAQTSRRYPLCKVCFGRSSRQHSASLG
jgi:phosphatidylserine/phosphatidylglycerophosphate/cardiolipin synthase-like enzyme